MSYDCDESSFLYLIDGFIESCYMEMKVMQISADVHNYMETLVGQLLVSDKYTSVYNTEQLADLACLALCKIQPVYIRYDVDFLSAIPEGRMVQLRKCVKDAVEAAELMIKNDRRIHRDQVDKIPVVVSSGYYSDELELKWYEKPIRSRGHDSHAHNKEK